MKTVFKLGFIVTMLWAQGEAFSIVQDKSGDYFALSRLFCESDIQAFARATLVPKMHKNCLKAGLDALNKRSHREYETLAKDGELRSLLKIMAIYKLEGTMPLGYNEQKIEVLKKIIEYVFLHAGGASRSLEYWAKYKKEQPKDIQLLLPNSPGQFLDVPKDQQNTLPSVTRELEQIKHHIMNALGLINPQDKMWQNAEKVKVDLFKARNLLRVLKDQKPTQQPIIDAWIKMQHILSFIDLKRPPSEIISELESMESTLANIK
jgi:hypothetical protein